MKAETRKLSAKDKLLNASLGVIRTKGYSATTVDDLCEAAGVTKGAFFHHFENKEALGVAAAQYWSAITSHLFAHANYHQHKDPLDRFLGYIDFRRELISGEIPEFTGVSSPYEAPEQVELVIHTGERPVDDCLSELMAYVDRAFAAER